MIPRCPACYVTLTRARDLQGKLTTPAPGLISICGHCDAVMVVRPDFSRRFIEPEELIGQELELKSAINKAVCSQCSQGGT